MDPLAPTDPRRIGPFRIDGRLGVGGMGQVYLGVDGLGRRVAIKVAHPELSRDPGFRERFRREIRMAAEAPPWFTAPVLGADPDATQPWLATEFVDGPSLQARVADQGGLSTGELLALGARLATGLAIVHATGLVHRDLKPANVILAAQGPRLIDFGIARGTNSSTLTRTGHLLGTPSFMSPEQAAGSRDLGPPSDVFALGSLLVFAATGKSPFAAETLAGSIYKITNVEPDVSMLAAPLREVVRRCLIKAPADRPTAGQVRDTLGSGAPLAAATTTYRTPPPSSNSIRTPEPEAPTVQTLLAAKATSARRRRPMLWVTVAVLAAVVVAVLVIRLLA